MSEGESRGLSVEGDGEDESEGRGGALWVRLVRMVVRV